jgi:hypothetical protein
MRKLIFALSLASFAVAEDPPSRAARLSYINGTVSFQPSGVDDWVPAEPNRPMTTGDRLWTDEGSRAEMNLGSAAFRLNSRTNFTFLNLDDKTAQVQLFAGSRAEAGGTSGSSRIAYKSAGGTRARAEENIAAGQKDDEVREGEIGASVRIPTEPRP